MKDQELLLAEYRHFSESFWKNEDLGEKRVNFFVTLTTAIMAAAAALVTAKVEISGEVRLEAVVTGALVAHLAFGIVTLCRMVHRNRVTDEYKRIVSYLRELLRQRAVTLGDYEIPFAHGHSKFFRGGLAETVSVMNSVVLGVIAALWCWGRPAWPVIPMVVLLSLLIQLDAVHSARSQSRSETFRAGVGAVIFNHEGEVLACERSDRADAWQLPQGGIKEGETPPEAVRREVQEETGIQARDLDELSSDHPLIAYELPARCRSRKTGRGQVLRWFFFEFRGQDSAISLVENGEFKASEWISFETLLGRAASFKREMYAQLQRAVPMPAEGRRETPDP